MSVELAARVDVLRDEVLATAEGGDRESPGTEVFEAVLRILAGRGETNEELDLTLHESLARRMAWGDSAREVLTDAAQVSQRLVAAAKRAFRSADDEMAVTAAVVEAAASVARVMTHAGLSRVARDRATHLRQELSRERLGQALSRQRAEIARLEAAIAQARGRR
jgi:hypothetical protein